MKNNLIRAAIMVVACVVLAQAAHAQFQPQDNYWQQYSWPLGQSLSGNQYDYGIAADNTGRVYVATGSSVLVFNSSGVITTSWNVTDAQDLALYPGSNILAVVSWNNSANPIKIYDTSGNFIRQWGVSGSATGQLSNPSCVTIAPNGLVYVGEYSGNRISVFDTYGNFVRLWGQYGAAGGQFFHPSHLALGISNTIYVADSGNNRIQYFDLYGNFLYQYQDTASGWTPKGVFVSPDGELLLTIDGTSSTGLRWLTPNSQLISEGNASGLFGATWSPDGQYLYIMSTSQIAGYHRGFRTFGANPPVPIPLPTVLGAVQRTGTGYLDIDYTVLDNATNVVQVGAVAFQNGRTDLGGAIPMLTYAEGTATNLGYNIPTGQRLHLTWNAGVDWVTNQGNVSVSILAKDYRGLLDFHFITIPSNSTYSTPLVISQSPTTQNDFLGVWTWLIATGNTNISLQTGGNVYGNCGTNINVLLAQTTGTTTTTTPMGRTFIWSLMGLQEATTNQLFEAAMGTTGHVTQWTPRLQIDGYPGKVNEYSFDTSLFSTSLPFVPVTNVWWAVLPP
jgi:hypothetical protein